MIVIHHCGESYRSDDSHAGKKIRCTKCGQILTIEAPPQPKAGRASVSLPASAWPGRIVRRIRERRSVVFASAFVVVLGVLVTLLFHPSKRETRRSQTSITAQNPEKPVKSTRDQTANTPITQAARESTSPPLLMHVPFSLPTGTEISSRKGPFGEGTLTIVNGTALDAVIKLVLIRGNLRPLNCRSVFIEHQRSATLASIGNGRYWLRFTSGRDWDPTGRRFLESRSFSQFQDPIEFTVRQAQDGYYVDRIEVTLHTVPNGNIRKEDIDEKLFSEGDSPD